MSLLPEPRPPTLGLYDAQAENSERAWWDQLEVMIRAWLQKDMASCSWLDMADVQAEVGRRRFFDLRYWYASRYPFTPEAACEVARRVVAIGALRRMPRAKVIVLDADNTLWGGVVGEDGLDGIALGPDYPGNAFLAFQRRLLDFQQRGFLLAMCSKNNAADVDEVLQRHPCTRFFAKALRGHARQLGEQARQPGVDGGGVEPRPGFVRLRRRQ
ncbi:MAG: HAD-IIIC family phosphatase [Betaproteobacteria bacterium]|nr:HAD-IIIC family phosphatase [Betaproteobacteria bacterium]